MNSPQSTRAAPQGHCDPAFTRVREAFRNNFVEHGEVGAAVAVIIDGRTVVNLWGGLADAGQARPWGADTLVNFFSVGKGLSAICMCMLADRGLIEFDAPVSRYWPGFARNDKQSITIRQLLAHQAGLPAIREPLALGAMLDWSLMTDALERQTPWWVPGTAHGYHVNTFGFLVGELVRRAAGVTLGSWLREHAAGPLGADVHIGLPDAEHHRAATFEWTQSGPQGKPPHLRDFDLMRFNAYWNPPDFSGAGRVNTAEWRRAEMPSTNGQGTALGIATIYAALLAGTRGGRAPLVSASVLQDASSEHSYGADLVLERPSRFGAGFQLTQVERPLGPNAHGFGHFGAGGSLGFCDPDAALAFGYVMNQMGPRWQNPRNRALIDAVYQSLT